MRHSAAAATLAAGVTLILSSGCVDVRGRPLGPTGPDGDAPPPTSVVSITHPIEGQVVERNELVQNPGLAVEFTGRFRQGQELLLLAFTDLSPRTPVFASRARVDEEGVPRSTWVMLTSGQLEGVSEVEILLRVLETGGGSVISTDSVGVVVR